MRREVERCILFQIFQPWTIQVVILSGMSAVLPPITLAVLG